MEDVSLPLRERQTATVPCRFAPLAVDAERTELSRRFQPGRALAERCDTRRAFTRTHRWVHHLVRSRREQRGYTLVGKIPEPRREGNSGEPPPQLRHRPRPRAVEHRRVEAAGTSCELGLTQGNRGLHSVTGDAESLRELTGR
ncbi:MAG: hypothetical protein QOG85_689 [Gaiellaceae bacterium]|nr:hypothetical protein [Gaiellaceae bacterium]